VYCLVVVYTVFYVEWDVKLYYTMPYHLHSLLARLDWMDLIEFVNAAIICR